MFNFITVFFNCLHTKIKTFPLLAHLTLKEQNTGQDLHNCKHVVSFTLFAKHYTQ